MGEDPGLKRQLKTHWRLFKAELKWFWLPVLGLAIGLGAEWLLPEAPISWSLVGLLVGTLALLWFIRGDVRRWWDESLR